MLKNRTALAQLTVNRLEFLAVVAVFPMTLAFATKPLQTGSPPQSSVQTTNEQAVLQHRAVNKLVAEFPKKVDLSSPESALAAFNRASAGGDDNAVLELSWVRWGRHEIEKMKKHRADNPEQTAVFNDALLNAEVLEVLTYRENLADVISKLKFPEGVGRRAYSCRSFGRIDGVWKNLGEGRFVSFEAARDDVDRKKDSVWQQYVRLRDMIEKGQRVPLWSESRNRSARIAPEAEGGPSGRKQAPTENSRTN